MKTDPPEKIRRITNTYPNNRDSPFYGQPLKPMARLVIQKNKDACTTDSGAAVSSEYSPSTDELVSKMKKKMMMKKKLGKFYVMKSVVCLFLLLFVVFFLCCFGGGGDFLLLL